VWRHEVNAKKYIKKTILGLTLPAVKVLLLCHGTTAAPAKATSRVMKTFGGKGRTDPA
jgi:hypothetical protein